MLLELLKTCWFRILGVQACVRQFTFISRSRPIKALTFGSCLYIMAMTLPVLNDPFRTCRDFFIRLFMILFVKTKLGRYRFILFMIYRRQYIAIFDIIAIN